MIVALLLFLSMLGPGSLFAESGNSSAYMQGGGYLADMIALEPTEPISATKESCADLHKRYKQLADRVLEAKRKCFDSLSYTLSELLDRSNYKFAGLCCSRVHGPVRSFHALHGCVWRRPCEQAVEKVYCVMENWSIKMQRCNTAANVQEKKDSGKPLSDQDEMVLKGLYKFSDYAARPYADPTYEEFRKHQMEQIHEFQSRMLKELKGVGRDIQDIGK